MKKLTSVPRFVPSALACSVLRACHRLLCKVPEGASPGFFAVPPSVYENLVDCFNSCIAEADIPQSLTLFGIPIVAGPDLSKTLVKMTTVREESLLYDFSLPERQGGL